MKKKKKERRIGTKIEREGNFKYVSVLNGDCCCCNDEIKVNSLISDN